MRTSALVTDHFTLGEGLWVFHTKSKQKSNYFLFGYEQSVFLNKKEKNIVEKIQAQIIIFVISDQINDRSLIITYTSYIVYLFFNFHLSKS